MTHSPILCLIGLTDGEGLLTWARCLTAARVRAEKAGFDVAWVIQVHDQELIAEVEGVKRAAIFIPVTAACVTAHCNA